LSLCPSLFIHRNAPCASAARMTSCSSRIVYDSAALCSRFVCGPLFIYCFLVLCLLSSPSSSSLCETFSPACLLYSHCLYCRVHVRLHCHWHTSIWRMKKKTYIKLGNARREAELVCLFAYITFHCWIAYMTASMFPFPMPLCAALLCKYTHLGLGTDFFQVKQTRETLVAHKLKGTMTP